MSRSDSRAADPVRAPASFDDSPAAAAVPGAIPHAALALLPTLAHEAGREFEAWHFLAASPRFCLALMLQGALLLAWAAPRAHASLNQEFFWATAVLIGIAAVTRNHIRGFGRTPRALSPARAATELRLLLSATGIAWGLGAFALLPPGWTPALAFALVPILAAFLILKDEIGAAAFGVPVAVLTASAMAWSGQSRNGWGTGALLIGSVIIMGHSMLQCAIARQRARELR